MLQVILKLMTALQEPAHKNKSVTRPKFGSDGEENAGRWQDDDGLLNREIFYNLEEAK